MQSTIAVIGAGPRGVGVLERISANLGANPGAVDGLGELHVHLIDPHPPGAGQIWRFDQSGLLKLNSMAQDVTMFTDDSCTITGPVVNGPSLIEWVAGVRDGSIPDVAILEPSLRTELETIRPTSFPTRRLQSLYLDWFYRRAVASLPEWVTVTEHRARAVAVSGGAGQRQEVLLDTGETVAADVVLYALGHTGTLPEPAHAELAGFARTHDLFYLPPAYTADADLGDVRAAEPVIVRGMGLAAIDLVVLLTEGRGGRFERGTDGVLGYAASGTEPTILLGSRRGVPYRSKVTSTPRAGRVAPRFFSAAIAAALEAASTRLDFASDVWPLIAKEVLHGYYHELFVGHPSRVARDWPDFLEHFTPLRWDSAELDALVRESVPDPRDRLSIELLDRPLAGTRFASRAALQEWEREHIETDLELRSDAARSANAALCTSLLYAHFDLGSIITSPKLTPRSRIVDLAGWFPSLFSYIASGPPGHRLEELVALSRAGIVEFLGAGAWAEASADGHFVAGSQSVAGIRTARMLIDARLPRVSIRSSDAAVLRSLVATGSGVEERLADEEYSGTTGRLLVDRLARIVGANGESHPGRFAIGAYTSAPFVGAFARPNTNAVSFRENDRVAQALLELVRSRATVPVA